MRNPDAIIQTGLTNRMQAEASERESREGLRYESLSYSCFHLFVYTCRRLIDLLNDCRYESLSGQLEVEVKRVVSTVHPAKAI